MTEHEQAASLSNEAPTPQAAPESQENFGDLLLQYERSHSHAAGEDGKQLRGTVVSVTEDAVYVDIGYKSEGVLPLSAFAADKEPIKPGNVLVVSSKGRNPEGYYDLSRLRIKQPADWESFEEARAARSIVAGTVTALVKGGLTVDLGIRAFMPNSRSGARDAAEMEKLVGQQIECRITSVDIEDENVIVDRRSVLEEVERSTKDRRYAEMKEGDIVSGTVRSITDYGAFLELGGVDGLLHIGELSWRRVARVDEVLTVGETLEVKIVKIDPETRRIALSRKQLLPHPWDAVPTKYSPGQRIRGVVTRAADFGAFVELEPGVEGMVHLSEMSWAKKVRKAEDMVKVGETVDAVILGIDQAARRISLGLKQTLGDPWVEAAERFAVGSMVEGPVSSFTKFGAFVKVAEGVEGMVHISEITAEKRLNHPQDVLRTGQIVQAKVLAFDKEKRQLRLSIKQMVPTGLDDFLAEHHVGDTVTGRIIEVTGQRGRVELGEGIVAPCQIPPATAPEQQGPSGKLDLSSLTSLLHAKWKGGTTATVPQADPVKAGQIRGFKITRLDLGSKEIDLELA